MAMKMGSEALKVSAGIPASKPGKKLISTHNKKQKPENPHCFYLQMI